MKIVYYLNKMFLLSDEIVNPTFSKSAKPFTRYCVHSETGGRVGTSVQILPNLTVGNR